MDPHTGLGLSDTVASTGPATATFSLFAGLYDVYFDVAVGSTVLPSQTVLLKRGVSPYEMDGYRLATVGRFTFPSACLRLSSSIRNRPTVIWHYTITDGQLAVSFAADV